MKNARNRQTKLGTHLKKAVALCLTLVMLMAPLCFSSSVFAAPESALSVAAPDIDLKLNIWLDEGRPFYSIDFKGKEIVGASRMGLDTTIGSLSSGFTGIEVVSSTSKNETWNTVAGEKATVLDKYNAKVYKLTTAEGSSLSIEAKAYNTGVAFRYLLPNGEYTVNDEQTRFAIANGCNVVYHRNSAQSAAANAAIGSVSGTIYPPFTCIFDDAAMTITVANVDNYIYPLLNTNSEGRFKPRTMTGDRAVQVTEAGPFASPYWTFVIGDSLADLPNNKDIILNLNEKPDEETYHFSEWVKPGKALMMGLFSETTETMKEKIDTCKMAGIDYVLMDFGWYGPEFYRYSDPRLDPSKLVEDPNDSEEVAAAKAYCRQYVSEYGVFNATGKPFNVYLDCPWGGNIQMQPNLNIPEIVRYGNSQGVGIFLYVNNVQLFDTLGRFDLDELFGIFRSWGVAGVKPGFVANKSQAGEESTRTLVETAAKYHLMLTIHDDWVQSGIERQYPNLLNAEGVYGDEGIGTNAIVGDINSLYARGLQGYADHTTCYPGKATRGYQLASAVLWPSALNCIYWPWRNTDTNNHATILSLPDAERNFWRHMPATWDELYVIDAEMSRTAAVARRTGDTWYLGAQSAVVQDLKLPLKFLDKNTQYVADIYMDKEGNNANNANRNYSGEQVELLITKVKVDSDTVIMREMAYGTGLTARIRPATEADADLPDYNDTIRADLAALIDSASQEFAAKQPGVYDRPNAAANKAFAAAIAAATAVKDDASATGEEMLDAAAALESAIAEFRLAYEIITLDKTSLSLATGMSYKLNATVEVADPNDKAVTWSSSNTNVASVDNTGNVTARTAGTATITARPTNGSKTATCTVKVTTSSKATTVSSSIDSTIQSWKASNADEQTRNYGRVNVLRLLSNLPGSSTNADGQYGKYGADPATVGVSSLDTKVALIKYTIPTDRNITGAKLSLVGQGVKSGVSGNTSIEAVRVTTNAWQEGNSSGNSDVAIGNITDNVTWRHLGTDLNYQLAFDYSTNCVSEPFSVSGFAGKSVDIDVLDLIKNVEGDTVSIALFETGGKEIYLHSCESSTTAYRPVLTLEFGDENVISVESTTEGPIYANDRFTVDVVTSSDVKSLNLTNENGMKVGKTLVSKENIGDGLVSWKYSLSVGTAGTYRTLTFTGLDSSGEVIGSNDIMIDIARRAAELKSFEIVSEGPIYKNDKFTVQTVTNDLVSSIAFTNENGMKMGKTLVAKTAEDGTITWQYALSCGTAGTGRQLNVSLTDKSGNVITNAGKVTFDILNK